MATVDIRGIRKTYPGSSVEVIKGIDLSVSDGEFLVLLGPSGCGKSTLLRMVAGLERVTEGSILIGDREVTNLEPKDRDIAMVFQNYALYPHMSVFDNMAYGLRIKGLARADIERRVRDAARILEIEPFLDRKPRQLSGGQRQRVAMGRAIVREPKVFLFDEPLSNLDAKLRTQMRVEIKRLQSRLGVTALYVTHDQVEAMTMADRIVVLNAGVAEQVDTPLSVYARPASLFVAGFIGSPAMNMLKGRVDEDGIHLSLPGGQRLRGPGVAGLGGREVIVGIRPENLADPSQADPEHRLELEIDLVEALGADSIVHGRIGDGLGLIARMPGTVTSRPGDRITVGVGEADIRLFDPDSGRALA